MPAEWTSIRNYDHDKLKAEAERLHLVTLGDLVAILLSAWTNVLTEDQRWEQIRLHAEREARQPTAAAQS
jgi:hypothetical protein